MQKLVIDRTRWLRGEGPEESALLRPTDNKMCCLGFDALRRGLTSDEIKGVEAPKNYPLWNRGLSSRTIFLK